MASSTWGPALAGPTVPASAGPTASDGPSARPTSKPQHSLGASRRACATIAVSASRSIRTSGSRDLDDHRNPHPASDAQRRDPFAAAPRAQRMDERRQHPRPAGADWMPERNGAASRIHLAALEPKLLEYRDRLDCECFVQLEQIDVRRLQLRPIERLFDRRHGTHAHDGGIDAGGRKRENARQWLPSELRGALRSGDDDSGGAVVDARGVARRDRSVLLERRLQAGELLWGSAGAWIFVGVERDRIALLLWNLHRHDLVLEQAGLNRALRTALTLRRVRVLLLAAHVEPARDVLRRSPHVIAAHRARQPLEPHRVEHPAMSHM